MTSRRRTGICLLWALAPAVLPCGTVAAQELSPEKQATLETVEALSWDIRRMSETLWEYSETALLEDRSAEFLAQLVEREGFTVERGVAGMPTAFIASYGTGRPIIGILAEYDALPGVGNAAVPRRSPRDDGVTSGQGCGHNLFGAGSVAAAVALRRVMQARGLEGTIRLYGTPAEETVVGKVYMAKAGVFDDLDAALEWHPSLETGTRNQPGRAMNNFTVEFFGQAAHASSDPWNGRSALDAVELLNHGVNMMREHIKPTARIHYVMPSAGEAPNVVPAYAKVWYYARDVDRESVAQHYNWILEIAEGAALATRTTHKVTLVTGVHETLLNRPLQEAVQRNLELVGAPDFAEEDQDFARELQRFLEIEERGLDLEIKPLADGPEPPSGGSTDVAEVSYITPTVGFTVTTAAAGVPWHSWATSASHGTTGAVRGAFVAAKVLALTGMDLLTDATLLERARTFFEQQRGGQPYESPIPVDQPPPLPKRDLGR
ncbi:MAG: amidohydrolase [Gemmatimonadales bacterium]|nr:amidohydrolase [Gemmatimonadales bacterium]NIN11802.1 amidohydrolase [Gemmatimonadales bacterium]NIN50352.1 amidohydrolase [Gemmatimonadales bacterium]NIP07816.1 amidohydrolase [Gemmatimonadales bacterium]NIR01894.1 amidohydrolase [Gemmatimonadales bacterium]